ncbi:hypothetical protein H7X65_02050 [Candidatus Parcubacteria bacterium]|nr:hypothetical protein [Candidatus Parcubacteria bacterium]
MKVITFFIIVKGQRHYVLNTKALESSAKHWVIGGSVTQKQVQERLQESVAGFHGITDAVVQSQEVAKKDWTKGDIAAIAALNEAAGHKKRQPKAIARR